MATLCVITQVSEVYSQMLCQGLATNHEVHVFTREEDPFLPDYFLKTETDPVDTRITLHLMNLPSERLRYQYRHTTVDQHFSNLLDQVKPDIVHIGHLNHLSTSIINTAHTRNIPIVFTLHDYWLMCPRGQFMQRSGTEASLWAVCDGQADRKCATQCYAGCASGAEDEWQQDNVTQNLIRTVDTTPPSFTCPSTITQSSDSGICGATINITNPTPTDNCGTPNIIGIKNDAIALNAVYPVGTTDITWTATDACGLTSSCTQSVIVSDNELPELMNCPSNIVVCQTNAEVTFTNPTATDNCAGVVVNQSTGLPSGATYPVGVTTNTFIAQDLANNNSAPCIFTGSTDSATFAGETGHYTGSPRPSRPGEAAPAVPI